MQTKYQTDDYEQYVFRMVVAQLKIEEVVSYTAVWLIERYNRACRSCGRPGFFFCRAAKRNDGKAITGH